MQNRNGICCYEFYDYTLYPNIHLEKNGEIIPLPPKELKVLTCLVERAGCVISKDDLLNYAWGFSGVSDESLTRCIYALRGHLGDRGARKSICTLYARGYYFNSPVKRIINDYDNYSVWDKEKKFTTYNEERITDVNLELEPVIYEKFNSETHSINKMRGVIDDYIYLYILKNSLIDSNAISMIQKQVKEILLSDPLNVDALAILGVIFSLNSNEEHCSLYLLQAKNLSPDNLTVNYYLACLAYLSKDYFSAYNILKNRMASFDTPKFNWLFRLVKEKFNQDRFSSVGSAANRYQHAVIDESYLHHICVGEQVKGNVLSKVRILRNVEKSKAMIISKLKCVGVFDR